MNLITDVIPLRWSSISYFARCQRRYSLGYIQHFIRKPGPESRARILGNHIHAGFQAALLLHFRDGRVGAEALKNAAVAASRKFNQDNIIQGKTYFDYESKSEKIDSAYYEMMQDVVIQANHVLNYQIPRIGLGTKYRVASIGEVLGFDVGPSILNDHPFVEWNFHQPVFWSNAAGFDGSYEYDITGTVDAVLYDLQTKEYVVFDWKSRKAMPQTRLIDLDGQLKLYAAIINHRAAGSGIKQQIAHTVQYNMLTAVPKPVTLTEKKREVSKSVGSTTWEVWSESLRGMGLDPADYEELREKMHAASWFTNPVSTPVTPISSRAILLNVLQWGEAIRIGMTTGSFPALPSMTGCQYCDFKSYCAAHDNGGDIDFVLQNDYMPGDPDGDEMEETVEMGA